MPDQRLHNLRVIMAAMASAFLAWSAWIAWTQQVTIHGKRGATTYLGADSLPWAALMACIGIALLGVMFRNVTVVACWMAFWMIAGVAAVLAPAFLA